IVSPQGWLNLQDVVRKDAVAATAPVAAAPAAKPAAAPTPAARPATPPAAGSQSAALAQMIAAARPPIDVKTIVMQG
ncbi:hypothetical protein NK983_35510, partial [Salmonella enterica subsp. enterica serovar Typhimurium]|nr:hypothetical protein [Salmonella enterica subsp. enterica serovar Typhimurium]